MPVRDVLVFNEHAEEIIEEFLEMLEGAVASGVGQVVENIDFQ